MLTVKIAAERISVSVQTVYRLIETGELPHYRVGNAIRIAEHHIRDFLAAHEERGGKRDKKNRTPRPRLRYLDL
jgi:excisionase family DNA binding protein